MDDSSANMTTGELLSNNFYGYLKHPSGVMLPKVLRDQLQQSWNDKGGEYDRPDDSCHDTTTFEEIQICRHQNQNRGRYWNVTEIVDMLNATSHKIQNVQTQIINGEDYYVNNVTSISVYNTKNNYSDSTTFLDSKTDSTSANNYPSSGNTGSNATTNSHGMNNQHRWFSSSFTNMKPYQQTIPYPTIPRKENISSLSLSSSSRPNDTISTVAAATTSQLSRALELDALPTTTTTAPSSEEVSSSLNDAVTTTVSKRGRNINGQPQPPPARRSTKRRRKT